MRKKLAKLCFFIALICFFNMIVTAVSDEITVDLLTPIEMNLPIIDGNIDQTEMRTAISKIVQSSVDAVIMDNPYSVFWVDFSQFTSGYSISYYDKKTYAECEVKSVTLRISAYDEATDPKGMAEMLDDAIDSFTPSGNTMYDYVKSIHDFVCSKTVYDSDDSKNPLSYRSFGALVNGRAVCQGYSEAFKILCDRYGIPCVLVTGTGKNGSSSENHMWCYVKMDDGKWYAVDTTWDDGNKITDKYLLVGSKTVVYKKEFSNTHVEDGDVSRSGVISFEYPELSEEAYENTGVTFTPNESNAVTDWFYSQISDESKNVYDKLSAVGFPEGATKYVVTTAELTTDETTANDDTTTTAATKKPKTTTAETTVNIIVTTEEETETVTETESDVSATESITLEVESDSETTAIITVVIMPESDETSENTTDSLTACAESEEQTEESEDTLVTVLRIAVIVAATALILMVVIIILIKVKG